MTFVKNNSYCDMPFDANTPYADFYIYSDLKDVADRCTIYNDEIMKCRTIGILQSVHGRFFLSDLSGGKPIVQLSVVYLNSLVQSTVIPYPVQVFGTLQWKKRPVIFAKILQVLSIPSAIRLRNALSGIANTHLAKNGPKQEYEEDPT
ncbi:uncharacterized protein LOC124637415 [Helicoverpa zea]|uniref:uncharacterized protein LOC124637415 n=1 Tax=Helicoverpa zea TaxID=7113 RepID=UPI001F5770FF|nr:uncharacterized protein LOC124637415 [Helicoverpa zea]XP_047029836.1 uncharacterized protein LOC124637415 [Helicoverpa zea]